MAVSMGQAASRDDAVMIIAHDLGTTGNKASLHEDDGSLISAVTVPYPTHYGPDGVVEQQPADWWDAVCRASAQLLGATGRRPADVRAVAVSGQMMGLVLLGREHQPLRPSIIWADTRSGVQCAQLAGRIDPEAAYRLTGHRLNPTYTLSKLMWVRDNEPEVFDQAHAVCLAKDYVVLKLTGVLATDASDASGTNAYDQQRGTWSSELLRAAGLPASLFPRIVDSASVIGEVTASAATVTGIPAGTPVVMGGGDGPMAAVGAGVIDPGDGAYLYLGSSSWVSVSTPAPLHDLPLMRTMTFNHVVPGQFVPTATMQAGGGSLSWLGEVFSGISETNSIEVLLAEATGAQAAADGLFFLPYLLGERSPYWNPAARGAFVGLGRNHHRSELARAVLEGVAFNLLTCIEALRERGAAIEGIDAIGGGAASSVWLQVLADVWGCPVRRRSVVEEANSLGAAITGAVAVGLLDDFTNARSLSTITAEFSPSTDTADLYADAHRRFVDAYLRLEPWMNGSMSS